MHVAAHQPDPNTQSIGLNTMTNQSKLSLKTLDRANFLHPFTNLTEYKKSGGKTIVSAEHIFLKDNEGNRILDGMSGLWCTNLGYSQPTIVQAVTEQLETLPYYNSFFNCTTDTTIKMSKAVADVLPDHINHIFFTNSGSEANDTNIRLVHRYFDLIDKPQKKAIISRENAYHGSTIAGASLGGMKGMHKQFIGLDYVHHVQQPYSFECANGEDADAFGLRAAQSVADKIDELGAENVAAFIAEPIQGAGGVIIPPSSYWPAVEKHCRDRDVLVISDEVICGFGRTGSWFGCDTFNFKPDLVTFAKAVTNGYQPLGGVGISDQLASVLTSNGGEFAHGFTYSGHPAACAAGLATIAIYKETNLISLVKNDTAKYWQTKWQELSNHPIVGEVRTAGLLAAIELVKDKNSNARLGEDGEGAVYCRNKSIENKLMVRQVGNAIISAPPLIVSHAEIDTLINTLHQSLDMTAKYYGAH